MSGNIYSLLRLSLTLSSLGELAKIYMHTFLIILSVQTSKTQDESLFCKTVSQFFSA